MRGEEQEIAFKNNISLFAKIPGLFTYDSSKKNTEKNAMLVIMDKELASSKRSNLMFGHQSLSLRGFLIMRRGNEVQMN